MELSPTRCPYDPEQGVDTDFSPEPGDDAPRFELPTRAAPDRFPGLLGWFSAARSDALGLFPKPCFEQLRVDRKIALTNLAVVSDPASIREIFASRADMFELSNLHLRLLKPSLGDGLIVAQGEDWRRLRRASLMMIRRSKKVPRSGSCDDPAKDLAHTHGAGRDFPEHLSRLVLDLVATELIGHDQAISSPAITAAIEQHRAVSERVDLLDVLGVTPRVRSRKMRHAGRIAALFDEEILGEIAAAGQAPPQAVKREEYRDLIVNLLTGYESIWLTCIWSMLAIAHNADLLRWLRLAGDQSGLEQRIGRVAQEILRLYPPLPLIYRKPTENIALSSGRYAKGQLICVSPYVVHRHRQIWEEPDIFALDRPQSAYRDLTYMPFGVGARRCVGASVSLPLITRVLAGLLDGHDPVSASPMPLPRMGLSLRPGGSYDLRLVRMRA